MTFKSAKCINETEKVSNLDEEQTIFFELGFKKVAVSQIKPKENIVLGGKTYNMDTKGPIDITFNNSPLSCHKCNRFFFL